MAVLLVVVILMVILVMLMVTMLLLMVELGSWLLFRLVCYELF